jgi:VanZ family protein
MKFIKYQLPAILWMATIFFLSSRTKVKVSDVYAVQFLFFKTLHILEYEFLYFLVYRALRNTVSAADWKNRYNALLLALVYAISDEVHQVFVPTREGRLRDVGIDLIGISLMAYFLWKLLPKMPRQLTNWARKLAVL